MISDYDKYIYFKYQNKNNKYNLINNQIFFAFKNIYMLMNLIYTYRLLFILYFFRYKMMKEKKKK